LNQGRSLQKSLLISGLLDYKVLLALSRNY